MPTWAADAAFVLAKRASCAEKTSGGKKGTPTPKQFVAASEVLRLNICFDSPLPVNI